MMRDMIECGEVSDLLSYEEFEVYMNQLQAFSIFDKSIQKACSQYTKDCNVNSLCYDECTIYLPMSPCTMCIELLERLMQNKYETISYFIYELDFGAEWKPGMVVDKKGNDVKLTTLRELYDYLLVEADELGEE